MKLSFYINKVDASPENVKIFNGLNKLVESGKVTDANVFFNDVAFNPVTPKFGMFDGANIWHYTGTLVVNTMQNLAKALNAVNKFNLVFLYDRNQSNTLWGLLEAAGHAKVVVMSQEDQDEYYRLTGAKPRIIENFEDFGEI